MPSISAALLTLIAASNLVAQIGAESDASVLLQGSIEKKRVEDSPALEEIDEESAYPELLKECDVKEESASLASPPEKKIADTTRSGASAPKVDAAKMEKEDPPGAATLKMVLQLAVIGLFADGYSRLRKQQQEKQQQPLAKKFRKEDEESAQTAWTEMVAAISDADELCFEKALCSKPPLNQADPWGCTPLHFAAKGGSTTIVSELLKRGAEVNATDAMDETPLHFAARAGHVEICDALLAKGATKDAMNVQDFTPLVVAGHAKQASTVSFLVEKGAGAGGLTDEALPLLVVGEIMKKVFAGGVTTESEH